MKEILQIIKADNSDVIYIKLTAVLILLIFVFNATFSNISTRSWQPSKQLKGPGGSMS
jgi:hypothetical protein